MSISSESTDGGGITTDHHDQQENLWPTNLEPFEEMRLLLARIDELKRQMNSPTSSSASFDLMAQNENEKRRLLARLGQLESQQPMNLQTSSEGFELLYDVKHVSLLATGLCLAKEELHQTKEKSKNTEEFFGKTLEQVAKLELENKELRAELAHQNRLKEQLERKMVDLEESVQAMVVAELEKCQDKQQQNIDKTEQLKVSINQLSLKQQEHEELSNAHNNKMEEQRKMDQKETNDKIDSFSKDQQEKCANNIRGMEQKQKDGQEELQRKMDESLKSVQTMVVAELEEHKQSNANKFAELDEQKLSNASKFAELEEHKQSNGNKFAELDEQKLSNANKFAEITQKNVLQQEKLVKLEKCQKEEQLNIVSLQKTVATLCEIGLINRWDSTACHPRIALSWPGRLVVQHNGKKNGWGSVIAEKPLRWKHAYFELKIVEKKGNILIGLATSPMPLDKYVGAPEGTYGYEGDRGYLWGHEFEGCSHAIDGRPVIVGKLPFGVDNVVGCGLNLETRQLIYTLNGKRLDTDRLLFASTTDLYPCVSLAGSGTEIEANFGPNFQYNITDGI
ncbi:hypothetical protein GPALN_007780 [Globodera pallida]|nr:hypothetical protein GPALN_007780 [Globodera pallida]